MGANKMLPLKTTQKESLKLLAGTRHLDVSTDGVTEGGQVTTFKFNDKEFLVARVGNSFYAKRGKHILSKGDASWETIQEFFTKWLNML